MPGPPASRKGQRGLGSNSEVQTLTGVQAGGDRPWRREAGRTTLIPRGPPLLRAAAEGGRLGWRGQKFGFFNSLRSKESRWP